ncbi:MAG TPA: MliC family protein [Devosiaceae bacterium]
MRATLFALGLIALPALAAAAETDVRVTLDIPGDAQIETHRYKCEGRDAPLVARYINAEPNYLALLAPDPDGRQMIFSNVIAASGARYAAGQYVWWTKGADATLQNITDGPDAKPIACREINDTP